MVVMTGVRWLGWAVDLPGLPLFVQYGVAPAATTPDARCSKSGIVQTWSLLVCGISDAQNASLTTRKPDTWRPMTKSIALCAPPTMAGTFG
jgi:hypothetical protein